LINKSLLRILGVLLAFTMVAAACGSDDDDEATETETTEAAEDDGAAEEETATSGAAGDEEPEEEAGGEVSGEVVISGSSTVEPISVDVAQSFATVEPGVNVAVDGPGTGDGFVLFCGGETDISDASRAIKDEEIATCEENGVNYVELKVAVDGLAVITNAENADVECLSFGDLYALVGPESTNFTNWSDANDLAAEVGGNGGLPDADLVITAPGEESGTFDSFIEITLEGIAEERGQEATTRPDYSSAADDNLIIESASTNPTGFGWVGYAFAIEASGVKLLSISEEGGGECIEATPETIASNEYPIARDLFIYVNTDSAAENPAIGAYIDYYMSYGLDEGAANVGYVALDDESREATRSAWAGTGL
jgi:phosphate transport system substrate-binding protein